MLCVSDIGGVVPNSTGTLKMMVFIKTTTVSHGPAVVSSGLYLGPSGEKELNKVTH